ncbi:MAG TPA: hypothetical protein ENJ41_03745, partial [Oceanospirillales bacterium]|nr:hypothetical protein [Oceanospirillales bacterium]
MVFINLIRLTLLLFLFCLPLATASAVATINADIQEKYIPSTLYTVKNGLLSNFVSDLVQDGSGFIWLATDRGLSRYDSINFLNFIKDKSNPFSIPGVAIQEFILMPNNEIWLSIENAGITIFNQTSQKFTSKKNTHSNLFHMPNKTLLGMSRDKNDNAWFSLYGEGVYQWNVQEQQFYKHTQNDE